MDLHIDMRVGRNRTGSISQTLSVTSCLSMSVEIENVTSDLTGCFLCTSSVLYVHFGIDMLRLAYLTLFIGLFSDNLHLRQLPA